MGEADLGHMLRLRDVDPDEEPVPAGTQRRLELAKPLDSDCIWTETSQGVLLLLGLRLTPLARNPGCTEEKPLLVAALLAGRGSWCGSLSFGACFTREILRCSETSAGGPMGALLSGAPFAGG